MTRRQRGRFVEEEQLGIRTGAHDGVLITFELEPAAHPGLMLPTPGEECLLVRIVNDSAVPHEGSAGGGGDQLAAWRDSILQGHDEDELYETVYCRGPPSWVGGKLPGEKHDGVF